jgi:hypothetical protein
LSGLKVWALVPKGVLEVQLEGVLGFPHVYKLYQVMEEYDVLDSPGVQQTKIIIIVMTIIFQIRNDVIFVFVEN